MITKIKTITKLLFILMLFIVWTFAPPPPVVAAGTTFVVDSTGDEEDLNWSDNICQTSAGTCTLRAAIKQSNFDAGTEDTITFNIPQPIAIIYIDAALPTIYTPMHIQGPNAHNGGAVVLNGKGNSMSGLVFTLGSGGSSVSQFDMRDFGTLGIYINSANDITISECVIGSTAAPSFPGNLHGGIALYKASGVQIINNLISGNGGAPGTGGQGISIQEGGSNTIQGNKIGTDITGTSARPNVGSGISIHDSDNNLIGGTSPTERNLISGNGGNGILISGGSVGTIIKGNHIGTNLSGTSALPNEGAGIQVYLSENTQIGGSENGAGNLISGNDGAGVRHSSSNSVFYGNTIGFNADGTSALPNQYGMFLFSGEHNIIGGTKPGQPNLIAGNTADGILVRPTTKGNGIIGNVIHDNGGLGINLLVDGEPDSTVTPNDEGDPDTGANDLQNFPILTDIQSTPTDLTVTCYLDSLPEKTFTLYFYGNDSCDPSTHGEGQHYLGTMSVVTNASNLAQFTKSFTTSTTYDCIAATATDANGNTSEFSKTIDDDQDDPEFFYIYLPMLTK